MARYDKAQLLQELKTRHRAIADSVSALVQNLTAEQLNWQPSGNSWSIAQILGHLIATHKPYVQNAELSLAQAGPGNEQWHTGSFLGEWMDRAIKPPPQGEVKRLKAPRKFLPASTYPDPAAVIEEYLAQQEEIINQILRGKTLQTSFIKLPLSVSKLLKLPIVDVWRFIASHNERHLLQMQKVQIQLQAHVVSTPAE